MKIVKILGGLGNQMFQYALAVALQQRYPSEVVKYDVECFHGYPLHNGFELDKIFNLSLSKASKLDIIRLSYPFFNYRLWQVGGRFFPRRRSMFEEKNMRYENSLLNNPSPMWYDGYWQCEKYFKEYRLTILREFAFRDFTDAKNLELSKIISSSNSTSIHIRRGDYLSNPMFNGICTVKYYHSSIQYIRQHTTIDNVIIFSNDIEWCKETFCSSLEGLNTIFVDWNTGEDSYRDLQLMSLCRNNIIANSSFSWWGAWLNKHEDKIVISPSRWLNVDYVIDVIPESWITIPSE